MPHLNIHEAVRQPAKLLEKIVEFLFQRESGREGILQLGEIRIQFDDLDDVWLRFVAGHPGANRESFDDAESQPLDDISKEAFACF